MSREGDSREENEEGARERERVVSRENECEQQSAYEHCASFY